MRSSSSAALRTIVGYTGLPAVYKPNTVGDWRRLRRGLDGAVARLRPDGNQDEISQVFIAWDD